jgi:hypothetical protein
MKARAVLPAALVAALAATPAFAHGNGGQDGSDDNGGKSTEVRGQGQDKGERNGRHEGDVKASNDNKDGKNCNGQRGTRGYIAAGTLASQALTKNADGTYNGTVTVNVQQTNRAAQTAQNTTQTYTLNNVWVRFKVPDRDANGTVDAADLRAGDRVKVFGTVAKAAKASKARKANNDTTTATTPVTVKSIKFKEPKAA